MENISATFKQNRAISLADKLWRTVKLNIGLHDLLYDAIDQCLTYPFRLPTYTV
jgi:hypothetical protein